jgi:hypothetical protein
MWTVLWPTEHLHQSLELLTQLSSTLTNGWEQLWALLQRLCMIARWLHHGFTQELATYLEEAIKQDIGIQTKVGYSMKAFGTQHYDHGVELSASCSGVVVWTLIREIGVDGMRDRIRRHNDMANLLARAAREHPNLELLLEPTFSIFCFRYVASGAADYTTV